MQLRGRRHLQFSYFDARRDVTKNYAGREAARQLDGLLDLPARSVSVQTARQTLNVQITKSGKAILHRSPGPCCPGRRPAARRRAARPARRCSTRPRRAGARGPAAQPAQGAPPPRGRRRTPCSSALGIADERGASGRRCGASSSR